MRPELLTGEVAVKEDVWMCKLQKKAEVASLTDCYSSNRPSLGWKIFGPHVPTHVGF